MPNFSLGEPLERKDKICSHCKHSMKETSTVEADCAMDEDVHDYGYCEVYEKKERGWG